MSVHSLKPAFNDRDSYLAWRKSWKTVYSHISAAIRRRKVEIKEAQRSGVDTSRMQSVFVLQRADARKMMTLLDEAKLRRDRILAMHQSIRDQNAIFPLTMDARVIDFAFNRVHNEFQFMPRWLVKANGKTFYIEHFDAEIGFSTREMTDPKTKGMLRFRNASMTIDAAGTATITARAKVALAA